MGKSIKEERVFTIDVDDERGEQVGQACGLSQDEGQALSDKLNKVARANDTFTGMLIDVSREMTDKEINYLLIMGIIHMGQPENPIVAMMREEDLEPIQ